MNKKLDNDETALLFKAILSLNTIEEVYDFFEDACTINEILAIAQRLHVAECLNNGSTYAEIKEKTGASSATISRVNRTLMYGTGAYKQILERIN